MWPGPLPCWRSRHETGGDRQRRDLLPAGALRGRRGRPFRLPGAGPQSQCRRLRPAGAESAAGTAGAAGAAGWPDAGRPASGRRRRLRGKRGAAAGAAADAFARLPGQRQHRRPHRPFLRPWKERRRRPHRRDGYGGLSAAGNSPPALWRLGLDGGRGRLRLAYRPGWLPRRHGRGGQRSAGDLPDPAL